MPDVIDISNISASFETKDDIKMMVHERRQTVVKDTHNYYNFGENKLHEVLAKIEYKSGETQNQEPYCEMYPMLQAIMDQLKEDVDKNS